ncbi:MAG: YajQ family cyclic di-GMP-binding protein [Candidatus Omnitrophica bacterium]|nr:YajQ family cyclic di-GMP-binding protein [Candidatus Omnitrophota bacterium]
MGQDHSFDFVSKVDMQELRNAIQQAQKEIATRFDFKGTSAGINFDESTGQVKITADHSMQIKSVVDVLETKMVKRGVSLKAFSWKEPEQLPSGTMKQQASLQQGLSSEKAKEIVKAIKELNLKVQPRIDGEKVRVSGRQLDDLQAVIQSLKGKDFGVPLQTENYR